MSKVAADAVDVLDEAIKDREVRPQYVLVGRALKEALDVAGRLEFVPVTKALPDFQFWVLDKDIVVLM
ncbi:MAG: hypothetical protein HGA87_02880 [Desulfobulbaceae bacterium]|nr:hypothetical protein [Desulfobulbaceae bacterium]